MRETVPDSIFDRADAVELVDLTPEDLIEPPQGGQGLRPQAGRARAGALLLAGQSDGAARAGAAPHRRPRRRAAADADAGARHRRGHGRPANACWSASARIRAPRAWCATPSASPTACTRPGRRSTSRRRRSLQLSEEQRDRIADTLRLAQSLGGEAVTIPGGDRRVADDVIAYAQANNITHIVIGKSSRSRWFEILHGSVVHDLVRRAGNISVHVIAGEELAARADSEKDGADRELAEPTRSRLTAVRRARRGRRRARRRPADPARGSASRTSTCCFSRRSSPSPCASAFGRRWLPAWRRSLCYNFFFLPPLYTFTIADPKNVAAFVFFALMATLVSNVAARVRTQALMAMGRARTTESLYAFSRKLAGVGTLDDVLWATAYQIALMLKVRVVLLLPEDGSIAVKAGYPPEDTLDEADLAAAKWAWQSDRPAGRGSDTLPGAKRLFLPMRTGRGAVGVVGIDSDKSGPDPHARRAAPARRADRPGGAGHRAGLSGRGHGARQAHRRNRAAALGAADLDLARSQDAARRGHGRGRNAARPARPISPTPSGADLLDDDHRRGRAAQPLHRQSARHDQARIRRGHRQHRAARHRRDRRQRAAARRPHPGASTRSRWSLPPTCRCWRWMPCCSSRCCSTCSTMRRNMRRPARRSASRRGASSESVYLQVLDEGDGIPPADLEHIFDKFYRAQKGDQVRAGTGLGLAISRGFVEAMGGTITAANRDRSRGRGLHDQAADPGAAAANWTLRHERPLASGPGDRRRAADPQAAAHGPGQPGLRDPRGVQRQDRAGAAGRRIRT